MQNIAEGLVINLAWIESHQALEKHPKVLHLRGVLGVPLDQVLGMLHRFWWWCLDYAEDGDLSRYSSQTLSSALGFDVQKLIDSGFIDVSPNMRVHDWWDYIGRFLQTKYKNYPVKWQRIQRMYKGRSKASPKGGSKPKLPNLTKPNLTNHKEAFDMWYSSYPKKRGKALALKAWVNINPDTELISIMTKAVQSQMRQDQWTKDKGAYIPYPATWLNGKRWEDEITEIGPGEVKLKKLSEIE